MRETAKPLKNSVTENHYTLPLRCNSAHYHLHVQLQLHLHPHPACLSCHRQYLILLNQEQKKAYKPSLHLGRVHPESANTSVVTNK